MTRAAVNGLGRTGRYFWRLLVVLCLVGLPLTLHAQESAYHYDYVETNLTVHPDASVAAEELITFRYTGTYHQGWRSIPGLPLSSVRDVSVIDGLTGEPLVYSDKRLDSFDPGSWGKYTFYEAASSTQIEWYYNAADNAHTWALRYTAVDVVSASQGTSSLSWSLFADEGAPVRIMEATVVLPEEAEGSMSLNAQEGHEFISDRPDKKKFRFFLRDVAPGERVVVNVHWQKGSVDKTRFGLPLAGYALGAIVVLFLAAFLYFMWRRR